ncbi:hypothetical protein [Nonomuraea longicatena]|uniref:Secreted protein n=1 Tax=Nonomuraea longicatena TaxID=83682 RepID=A0ABP4AG86_9ACTN
MQFSRTKHRIAAAAFAAATAGLLMAAGGPALAAGPAAGLAPVPAAGSTLGEAAICVPEAPVCAEITGEPGAYRLSFTIRPAPQQQSVSFTVNGARASGSLQSGVSGNVLRGQFRPSTPLVRGDVACVLSGVHAPACATTP